MLAGTGRDPITFAQGVYDDDEYVITDHDEYVHCEDALDHWRDHALHCGCAHGN